MTSTASLRTWFYSPVLIVHHCWNARFSYILSLLLLLQRTPVIRHLFELPRQLAPKFADILRLTAPVTVGAGATHSVTGATGVVPVNPSKNPAQAKVGEPFVWVFRTTGEKAKSYSFSGLPPGVKDSGIVSNAVSSIAGTPTEPGQYRVRIIGWEKSGQRGRKTPTYTLTVNITGGLPPEITENPVGSVLNEGDPLVLSVTAGGSGLAYQWRRNGIALPGTAFQGDVLRIDSVTPDDEGSYSVDISNSTGSVSSEIAEIAEIAVRPAGSWSHWEAVHGVTDPAADPDGDGLSNLAEYALGSDPNHAGHDGVPKVRLERVNGASELVAEFQVDANATDSVIQVESTADLSTPNWTVVRNGEQGAKVSSGGGLLTVRIPADGALRFLRLTVALK